MRDRLPDLTAVSGGQADSGSGRAGRGGRGLPGSLGPHAAGVGVGDWPGEGWPRGAWESGWGAWRGRGRRALCVLGASTNGEAEFWEGSRAVSGPGPEPLF